MPLTNLHPFLIMPSHFRFNAFWLVYFPSSLFLYGNIISDLHPLFQENNYGVEQVLSVFCVQDLLLFSNTAISSPPTPQNNLE